MPTEQLYTKYSPPPTDSPLRLSLSKMGTRVVTRVQQSAPSGPSPAGAGAAPVPVALEAYPGQTPARNGSGGGVFAALTAPVYGIPAGGLIALGMIALALYSRK